MGVYVCSSPESPSHQVSVAAAASAPASSIWRNALWSMPDGAKLYAGFWKRQKLSLLLWKRVHPMLVSTSLRRYAAVALNLGKLR